MTETLDLAYSGLARARGRRSANGIRSARKLGDALAFPTNFNTQLVELRRVAFGGLDRGDFDTVMSFNAPDAVADASVNALEVFEGVEAIGNGVVMAAYNMSGRPAGSEAFVQEARC